MNDHIYTFKEVSSESKSFPGTVKLRLCTGSSPDTGCQLFITVEESAALFCSVLQSSCPASSAVIGPFSMKNKGVVKLNSCLKSLFQ